MKIGIITNLYPPYARGGAENVVVRTIEELTQRGHDVFVITAMPARKKRRIVLYTNAVERIYQFSPGNIYFTLDDHKYHAFIRFFWHVIDAFSFKTPSYIREILQDERPDVVITHNLKGIGLRAARAVQSLDIPHAHVVHDLQLIIPSGLKFAGREQPNIFVRASHSVYRFFTRHLIGKPNLVIFPSNYLKKEYTDFGFFKESDIQMMPNPAPDFAVLSHKQRGDGPLNLLFVGQLEDHKGINFLLDSFQNGDLNANLIIAGEGALVRKVKKAADNDKRITYLGFIAMDQLLNCFEIADALVVPSLCYENSPTVIYESLQAGIPVLASNIGGVGELVEDKKNGFLFRAGSKKDFLAAIQKLKQKREYFASNRDEIRNTVNKHALAGYTSRLVRMLQEITDSK